ncbi:LysR family transcriptional regulator [Yoonia litorea]|uniref:Transcriptional regulator, LysR family n=1 Tax=Yoonia litorea TaxID=1123755 RepID=A0A1I6LBF0_9RHOB|nr:LysR family transcriptional regulator [Yoonia litorea]SFS00759.1 transcriptional regulator, LysR family [Yoonia litorea]
MNWRTVSFDWNQIRAFLATAEEGSLSAAARSLGSTQPTVGRQIAALENDLKLTLFERAGRRFEMTAAARDLLEHVQAMGDAASRVSMVAAGQSEEIAGRVVITANDLMAVGFLPAALMRLRQEAPGIAVEVVASNRLENLTRRDADIAIRHVRPEQPDLIARQMRDAHAGYYAATRYLEQHGVPKTPAELARHSFVGPRDTAEMLSFLAAQGVAIEADQFQATSDSGVVMWEMMLAGLGILVGPIEFAPRVEGVQQILKDQPPIRFPVWLATHRELRTSKRIRIVFDLLAEELSKHSSK